MLYTRHVTRSRPYARVYIYRKSCSTCSGCSGLEVDGYGVVYQGKSVWQYKNQRITDFLTAVHAAFDLVDMPEKAVRLMREKLIEQKLVRGVKNAGGLAIKLMSPSFAGMPDRLVLLAGGRTAFVEVKAHGMKPRPLQLKRHEMLRRLGFKVYVIDDEGQIRHILKEMGG